MKETKDDYLHSGDTIDKNVVGMDDPFACSGDPSGSSGQRHCRNRFRTMMDKRFDPLRCGPVSFGDISNQRIELIERLRPPDQGSHDFVLLLSGESGPWPEHVEFPALFP